jgi:AcrR family transcriptional regulator
MTPDQRRATIVAAALPLVAEYGTAVTTAQIARAAGIGEATIFRVFTDKEELLDACMAEALSPDHVVRELASISVDQPLAGRLTEAAEALRAHLDRIGAVIGTLHASGHRPGGRPGPRAVPGSREDSMRAVRDGVADLVEPDRASVRLAPAVLASVFIGMLFTRVPSSPDEPQPASAELVSILLHGTLTSPGGPA